MLKATRLAALKQLEIADKNLLIKMNNSRLEALLRIAQYQTNSRKELLDFALHEAINLTESKIGYIYLYSEKKKQFTLNTWSKIAMAECRVQNPQEVYNLEKTGCWGEAVRQRKPIIINNYSPNLKIIKGIPKGHIKIKKFLTIPVFINHKIVAVVGVANKLNNYNGRNVKELTLLMDSTFKISEKISFLKKLKKAVREAKESDRLKTAFLNNLSHEIRTPLNGIVGFSQMLHKKRTASKQASYLHVIEKSSKQLLKTVNDIIDIAKIETKQIELSEKETNLNRFCENILYNHQEDALKKKLELKNCFKKCKLSKAIIDLPIFTQIINILIENAIKFTKNGKIEFNCCRNNSELKISISDTGIGISKELHKVIFEKFRQIESSTSRFYGGTGLGLPICKGLIELLNGRIWVESEPKKGSVFSFSIPFKSV